MDDEDEIPQEKIVERSAVFADEVPKSHRTDPTAIAALRQLFDDEVHTYHPESTTGDHTTAPTANAFNLFSTGSGPVEISLEDPIAQLAPKRPREYYFTNENDTERLSKLTSVAITTTQILEMATQPWAAKRNPRLVKTIPFKQDRRKRRIPTKKERDYKKKLKLDEEKKARDERRYEKYLIYGRGQTESRGSSRGRRNFGGRGIR